MPSKPMKPARAWVNLEDGGGIAECTGYPIISANKSEAVLAERNGWGCPVRVRILDDDAVERVVDLLRGLDCASTADEDRVNAAIRDLGGKV